LHGGALPQPEGVAPHCLACLSSDPISDTAKLSTDSTDSRGLTGGWRRSAFAVKAIRRGGCGGVAGIGGTIRPGPRSFMTAPCRRRVEALFDLANDLDPARLTTFLHQQCAADPDLRAAVEELLRLDRKAEATEFLLRSPVAGSRREYTVAPPV